MTAGTDDDRRPIMTQEFEPIAFAYDPVADIFTIAGHHYAGVFFRRIAHANVGAAFRIIAKEDGVITIQELETAP